MTINGVDCKTTILDNEITCRIPRNMTIPSQGAPVKVCNPFNSASINSCGLFQISFNSLFQVFVNGEVYDIGIVVFTKNSYIVGIVLGIIAALGLGAALAYVVMAQKNKRKKGKSILSLFFTCHHITSVPVRLSLHYPLCVAFC